MLAQELDARKEQILWAVIREYVARAEPVPSEVVFQRYSLGVSPATIRSGMHALTEMGYLRQPHTSAGRVPTDRAYRLYVDRLLSQACGGSSPEPVLSAAERERIRRRLAARDRPEEALEEAAQTLASLTEYPSVVSTPGGPRRLRHVHLVPLAQDRALVVLVTESGAEQRVLRLERPASAEELEEVSRLVSRWLEAVAGQGEPLERLAAQAQSHRGLLASVVGQLRRAVAARGNVRFFVQGVANILKQPEFQDVRRVRPVLAALDREEVLRNVLLPAPPEVHVRIGRENPVEDMRDCSVVAAAYRAGGRAVGVLGVVGPTRMPYARTIALVRYLAQTLSETLSRAV